MGSLEIICYNCGAVNVIQPDSIIPADKLPVGQYPYRCPHCMAEINQHLWDKMVFAFWTLEEVNKDLRTAHDGYGDGRPLFQVQYKTHYGPQSKILV